MSNHGGFSICFILEICECCVVGKGYEIVCVFTEHLSVYFSCIILLVDEHFKLATRSIARLGILSWKLCDKFFNVLIAKIVEILLKKGLLGVEHIVNTL